MNRMPSLRKRKPPRRLVWVAGTLAATLSVGVWYTEFRSASYDATVLADHPVGYWALDGKTADLSGRHHASTYHHAPALSARLPNGDHATSFDGVSQYVSVAPSPDLSIPTTGALTWEAWIAPANQAETVDDPGYVDFIGKCVSYAPRCEWEGRLYKRANREGRASRISAYVFNLTAGNGSGADWQPAPGVIKDGRWLHVVGEYQTTVTPKGCSGDYPGAVNVWVNGIKQNFRAHYPTGCMSQYHVVPRISDSPLLIGTMAKDTWFKGAIGKVAVYNYLLSPKQINSHYAAMVDRQPSGHCADACRLDAAERPASKVSARWLY